MPNSVCLGRRQIRICLRCDRRGSDGALDVACGTQHSDPDEWIKIDGARLKAHHGRLSLRFGEPMEEVNFIDQVRLVAVDHPEGTNVFPNERFLSETPFVAG